MLPRIEIALDDVEPFLRAFKRAYIKSTKVREYYSKWHSNRKPTRGWVTAWTDAMYEVFNLVAIELQVDKKITKGTKELDRADIRWFKNNHSYIIEHENDLEGIFRSEVPKVLERDADIKVIVTYLPQRRFTTEETRIIESMTNQIEEHKDKDFELLLLLARQDFAEEPALEPWTAHVWTKQFVRSRIML